MRWRHVDCGVEIACAPPFFGVMHAAMALTLYGEKKWYSPYVFHVFVALKEKQLDFELRELDLDKKETRAGEYLAKSVTAKVPVLQHDDFWVGESLAISEYLAETFPFPKHPKLFPADFKERARARQVMLFLRSDLMALRTERSTDTMFYERAKAPLSAAAQANVEELFRIADLVIPNGKTSMFAEWCIADADLAFCLQRLGINGHELPKKLKAYVEAQWARPSVQAFVNHPRPKL